MYLALYRKYRPMKFSEMIGQEYVIQTLRRQVMTGHISHAYLFCGLRGTGKTTAAKILARAINCESASDTGDPCGVCGTCKALAEDNNLDIIEIDAASNNGVDEIRSLRDKVVFPPYVSKYKVYIIDEVHMMTSSAFNALLKTLEEPPEHAVFILATTEANKLPATILSRCQRFDFRHIPEHQISAHLAKVLDDLNIGYETEALTLIARIAEGGMRDALSLTDMCIAYLDSDSPKLTYNDALLVLGSLDRTELFNIADAIINTDAPKCMEYVEKLISEGKSVSTFMRELMTHIRDVLLIKECQAGCRALINCTEEVFKELSAQAEKADRSSLIRALDILTEAEASLRQHTRPRIILELALIKICRPQDELSMDALTSRIAKLEKELKSGMYVSAASSEKAKSAEKKVRTDNISEPAVSPEPVRKKPNITTENGKIYTEMMKIVKSEKIALSAPLRECNGGELTGNVFTLEFPQDSNIFIDAVMRPVNKAFIEQVLQRITGKELTLRCRTGGDENPALSELLDIFGESTSSESAPVLKSELEALDDADEHEEFIDEEEYEDQYEEGEN